MKKIRNHFVTKTIGFLLCCICGIIFVCCAAGKRMVTHYPNYYETYDCTSNMYEQMDYLMDCVAGSHMDPIEEFMNPVFNNARYQIEKWNSKTKQFQTLETTMKDTDEYGRVKTLYFETVGDQQDDGNGYREIDEESVKTDHGYRISVGVLDPITVNDVYYTVYQYTQFFKQYNPYYYPGMLLSGIMLLIAFVYELIVAGHRYEDGKLVMYGVTKLPIEIAIALFLVFFMPLLHNTANYPILDYLMTEHLFSFITRMLAMAVCFYALIIVIVVQLKMKQVWRNSVLAHAGRFARLLPVIWQFTVPATGLLIFFVIIVPAVTGMHTTLTFVYWMVCIGLYVMTIMLGFYAKKMLNASDALAKGNLNYEIDEDDLKHLYGPFRQHADHLNSIRHGMEQAVEEQMRSERLKAELITNVSHDIKTPLTSIISYVDLLQKAETEEQRKEYLAVLERQSQRLKRLTEDVVEASKASTGNMEVHKMPTSIPEIIEQALGEYQEKLDAVELQVVQNVQEEMVVETDGRLLWRVIRNLLSNVSKYALHGTRVYLDAFETDNDVIIRIRNTSKDQLNITPNELLERFTRGDESRHTEGSGLGLNIAQSLTELIGGQFELSIDADLFKVEIHLPK